MNNKNHDKIFSKFLNTIHSHTQKAQLTPSKRNMKKTTPMHIIVKLLETSDKEKIIKAVREQGRVTREEQA